MNTSVKLVILADAAKYDASCASSSSKRADIWDGNHAQFAPGVPESQASKGDVLEELWRT